MFFGIENILKIYFIILYFNLWCDFAQCESKPNMIFILTDDQDLTLSGMDPMKKTRKIFRRGIEFNNMFVTSPLCCPSRASIFSGQYVHNHGVVNNSLSGNCNSRFWQENFENIAFAPYLKQAGYTTFFAGKYLNQYGKKGAGGVSHIPIGWDHWNALVGNSCYYDYILSINGKEERHGNKTKDYLTDVLFHKSMDFLLLQNKTQPFFMMIAPPSPHSPFKPASKYETKFVNASAPRTPNFNIPIDKTKHWLLRQTPSPLGRKIINKIDEIFKNRWRTLLSVDDGLDELYSLLSQQGLLENTYVFFTSDNGFHLGQFSLPWDKRQLYESDIRVPLLVIGPKIKHQLVKNTVLNIDLAPTFLSLAGIDPPPEIDGTSFSSYFRHINSTANYRKFIIEHKGEAVSSVPGCPQYLAAGMHTCEINCICEDSWNNTYICIRTCCDKENSIYCQFDDFENFVEFYNMTTDPYQLKNLYRNEEYHVFERYVRSLDLLKNCRGRSCQEII